MLHWLACVRRKERRSEKASKKDKERKREKKSKSEKKVRAHARAVAPNARAVDLAHLTHRHLSRVV